MFCNIFVHCFFFCILCYITKDIRGYGQILKYGIVYVLGDIFALPFYIARQTRACLFAVLGVYVAAV